MCITFFIKKSNHYLLCNILSQSIWPIILADALRVEQYLLDKVLYFIYNDFGINK